MHAAYSSFVGSFLHRRYFHTYNSKSRPLIQRRETPFASPRPLVVSTRLFTFFHFSYNVRYRIKPNKSTYVPHIAHFNTFDLEKSNPIRCTASSSGISQTIYFLVFHTTFNIASNLTNLHTCHIQLIRRKLYLVSIKGIFILGTRNQDL